MEIRIYGHNLEITPAIERHVRREFVKLEKFIGRQLAAKVPVEIGITSMHHRKGNVYRAEINLPLPGKLLRAEEEAENIHTAINIVRDELERQIEKYRGRRGAPD